MPQRRRGFKGTPPVEPQGGGVDTLEAPTAPVGDGRSRRRYDTAWDDWKPPRRWPGVLLACVVVLGFAGVVVWHYRPTHHAHHSAPRQPLPSFTASPSFVPTVAGAGASSHTFTGTVNKTGLNYSTTGGLVVLHAACLCEYNFVVTITNSAGIVENIPVDTSGHYNGTYNVTSPPGVYTIAVIATGPWSVQVLQPSAATPVIPTPFSYYSSGGSVIGPFSAADRTVSIQFLSHPDGTLYVHVLNLQGVHVQTPFVAKGYLQKTTTTLTAPPNPYYLEIDASGFWNLSVKR